MRARLTREELDVLQLLPSRDGEGAEGYHQSSRFFTFGNKEILVCMDCGIQCAVAECHGCDFGKHCNKTPASPGKEGHAASTEAAGS